MRHIIQTKFEVGQTVWSRRLLPPYEPKAYVITGYDVVAHNVRGKMSETAIVYHTETADLFVEQILFRTAEECLAQEIPDEIIHKNRTLFGI